MAFPAAPGALRGQLSARISAAAPLAQAGRRAQACRPVAARAAPQLASTSHIAVRSSLAASSSSAGAAQQRQQQQQQQRGRRQVSVSARAKDPDALDAGDDQAANQGVPSMFWRVFAALCYLVPWIDSISLGRQIYSRFRTLILLYFVPGPMAKVYFGSQFAPLIIFFLMFLAIVKNTKLHHFVRFNCMQAIMLDIVTMLFHILRAYLPSELKWSAISHYFDMFSWTACMSIAVYCVFWTLRGYYADIPFVSESVYHQVQLSEYA